MIYIETSRLILRDWEIKDIEPFVRLNANPEVMRYFPNPLKKSETEAMIGRLQTIIENDGFGFFAVEQKENGLFIGFIGLVKTRFQADFTPCVEIGWRLDQPFWKKGFAQEGALACLDFGFNQLDLNKIVSFTSIHNEPSEKVMQKIGMQYVKQFDHPMLEEGHWLRTHVLYEKIRATQQK